MRRIFFGIMAMSLGCSGTETSAPAATTPGPVVPGCVGDCGPVPTPNVLDSASYAIVMVNDKPLPVASPWGVGIWDYDEDAGTWQLVAATLTLKTNGTFANAVTHRAASGRTLKGTFAGTYTRTSSGSIRFVEDGLAYPPEAVRGLVIAYSAQIDGNRLVITFPNGGTFMFEELR